MVIFPACYFQLILISQHRKRREIILQFHESVQTLQGKFVDIFVDSFA